jgi:hypothetical protein
VGSTGKRKTWKRNQQQLIIFGSIAAVALLLVLGAMFAFRTTPTTSADPDGLDRTSDTPNGPVEPNKESLEGRMNRGGQTQSTPQPVNNFDDNLVGTTWRVTDSAGDEYVFMFQSNGVLHYEAGRVLRKNGAWKKKANTISIETNNGYATLEGTLSGNEMSGDGSSKNGTSWTWRAEPE